MHRCSATHIWSSSWFDCVTFDWKKNYKVNAHLIVIVEFQFTRIDCVRNKLVANELSTIPPDIVSFGALLSTTFCLLLLHLVTAFRIHDSIITSNQNNFDSRIRRRWTSYETTNPREFSDLIIQEFNFSTDLHHFYLAFVNVLMNYSSRFARRKRD